MTNPRTVRAAALLLALVGLVSVATARTWTSRDGKFTVDAELVDYQAGEVSLLKRDGSVIKVPLTRLSDSDQDFVHKQYPNADDDTSTGSDVRQWTSVDGKFTTRARFLAVVDGKARLEKPDGQTVDVPLTRLSEADQTWIKDYFNDDAQPGSAEEPGLGGNTATIGRLASSAIEMKLVETKIGKGNRDKPDWRTRYVLGATGSQYFYAQSGLAKNPHEESFKALVKKEPTYEYNTPFRAVAIIDSQQYVFSLDATGQNPKGYNRLHFDLNRNGDLTDDKPFNTKDIESTPAANQTTARSTFDHIQVPLERDGTTVDHIFRMFVDYLWTSQLSRTVVQLRSSVYREGVLLDNGRKVPLLLIDRNSNGRFDDPVSFRRNASFLQISDGDCLAVNPKPQGNRSAADSSAQDWHFLNKTVCLGGNYYKLTVSACGDRVTLEPADIAVGYISNANPVYRAVVCCDEHGVLAITGTKDQKVALPAGKWEIASYSLGASDNPGTTVAASFQEKATVVDVSRDSTSEMIFGAPFRAVVTGARQPDGKVGLSLSLVGQAGEQCSSLLVGGQRPPAPKFEVRDPAGAVVHSGQFEYG